jgi:hypothetical protein
MERADPAWVGPFWLASAVALSDIFSMNYHERCFFP